MPKINACPLWAPVDPSALNSEEALADLTSIGANLRVAVCGMFREAGSAMCNSVGTQKQAFGSCRSMHRDTTTVLGNTALPYQNLTIDS